MKKKILAILMATLTVGSLLSGCGGAQSGDAAGKQESGKQESSDSEEPAPETILSHSYFLRYPEKFYAFYRDKMLPVGAKPNAAHKKLAELEAAGKLKAIVTQNIDGLHQAAGSKVVYELHGSTHRNYCMKCGASCDAELVRRSSGVPRCEKCGGMIKPDVVLYEESLNEKVLDGAKKNASATAVQVQRKCAGL